MWKSKNRDPLSEYLNSFSMNKNYSVEFFSIKEKIPFNSFDDKIINKGQPLIKEWSSDTFNNLKKKIE